MEPSGSSLKPAQASLSDHHLCAAKWARLLSWPPLDWSLFNYAPVAKLDSAAIVAGRPPRAGQTIGG